MQVKIIKGIAGFYYVYAEETDTIYECKAKGIFRNRKVKPLVGDLVAIEVLDEEQAKGNITEILPRKNELIRPASANVDQAMVIFAAANPEPNFHLLDRFLVMMDYQNVPTVICFNKEDLIGADEKETDGGVVFSAYGSWSKDHLSGKRRSSAGTDLWQEKSKSRQRSCDCRE